IDDDAAAQMLAMPLSAVVLFESLALRAGDWMVQNAAFGAVGKLVAAIARAAGSCGMAGGQMMDIEVQGQRIERAALDDMHLMKTGALIRVSILLGAYSENEIADEALARLERFGSRIGLAFQIQDDILDATGDAKRLGKTAGADVAHDKPTYTAILGLARSREVLAAVYSEALEALEPFGEDAAPLLALAKLIVERDH
ncbi:MAG: polyprenyl synthetase family protein, partial [Bryobacteraceae bacterium]